MSVVPLDRPITRPQPIAQPRPLTRTRPSAIPEVRSNSRVIERKRALSNVIGAVVVKTMLFCTVASFAYGAMSLAGHVKVEGARRETLRAKERVADAKKSETLLRERLDKLTAAASIEEWANAHGFTAPDGLTQPAKREGLVALRH